MKRRNFIGLSAGGIAGAMAAMPAVLRATNLDEKVSKLIPEKKHNPNIPFWDLSGGQV